MWHAWKKGEVYSGFGLKKKQSEGLDVDGTIILKLTLKKQVEMSEHLIYLTEGRDKWQNFVNTVMNIRIP